MFSESVNALLRAIGYGAGIGARPRNLSAQRPNSKLQLRMAADRLDVADIRALLSSGNRIVQSQGLGGLFVRLKPPFRNPAERVAVLSCLFDCFTQFGDAVSQWTAEGVPHLVNSGLLTWDEVCSHCVIKLCSTETPKSASIILIRTLLRLSPSITSTCFLILQKCKQFSTALVEELLSLEISSAAHVVKVLLCSGTLSLFENVLCLHFLLDNIDAEDDFMALFLEHFSVNYSTRILINAKFNSIHLTKELLNRCSELSARELGSLQLSIDHEFTLAASLAEHPEFVSIDSFPKSHVLLLPLLSLYYNRAELAKSLQGLVSGDHLKQIKALTTMCQHVNALSKVDAKQQRLGLMSTSSYLGSVSSEANIEPFIDLWIGSAACMQSKEQSLTFACALLPYCRNCAAMDKCFNLVQAVVERCPETVNTAVMFLSMIYAKPHFKVDKSSVLRAFRGVFVSRYAVTPTVNFLSIICRQTGEERATAYGLLADLVTKFPSAFDVLKPLAIAKDDDSFELLRDKLTLVAALCVSTDRADELLPSLSGLLKKDAAVVSAAVAVVQILCKEEILDIGAIRKQLGARVQQPGYEEALVGYCRILATVADQLESHEENFGSDCMKELYEITQIQRKGAGVERARGAAWAALGSFDAASLANVVDISGGKLLETFMGLHKDEVKGFVILLHKLVAAEVESLSRSLYTRIHTRRSALAVFVSSLHSALLKSNQEAPWFWQCTLPLFPIITGEYGEGSAAVQSTRLLRRLLREVRTSTDRAVSLFAGWRLCIANVLSIQANSGDIIRARDGIVEECKRALKDSEFVANNVFVVLAVLAGELKRFSAQVEDGEATAAFETAMRPWLTAVLEFLLPLVFDDYQPSTQPLIQVTINRRCVEMALMRSALSMVCSVVSTEVREFFRDKQVFDRVSDWRIGAELDMDGSASGQLSGEYSGGHISLPRSELWMLAAAMGADEIVTNSLSRSLPPDTATEDVIESFVKGGDLSVDDTAALFDQASNLPFRTFKKQESRLRKRLEQLSTNAGEQMRRTIYEGLSKLAAASLLTSTIEFPGDYSHLADGSVLRAIIAQFCAASECSREQFCALLPAIVGHSRADGRHLPPLDLQFMLSAVDFENDEKARLNLLKLAFQQEDAQIVYELTSPHFLSEGSASASYWLTISKNLALITVCLPSFRAQNVLNGLLSFALKSDEHGAQILSDVSGFKGNQLVFDSLLAHAPSFDAASDLLHKALSCNIADDRFLGRVSRFFDFWLGCSGIVEEQLSKLIEVYIDEGEKPDVMLSIFGFCSMSLSLNDRLEKLVSLVSSGKVMLSCRKPAPAIEAVLRLFIALICSSPADIPFHWLAVDVVDLMFARWRYYWKTLTKESKFCEHFDAIVTFLFPCFLLDGLSAPVQNAVKGVLLYILASHPDIVRPYVEGKRAVWEKLIL